MASHTPNDAPHRVGARSYPKTSEKRLYGSLLSQCGISSRRESGKHKQSKAAWYYA